MDKILDVVWSAQPNNIYCGPATAQMFVQFAYTASGNTTPVPDQDTLWTAITSKSPQRCDDCVTFKRCWNTSPEAMQNVINALVGSGYQVGIAYPTTFDKAMDAVMKTLDATTPAPAIASKTSQNHWVIVNGYRINDASDPTNYPQVAVGNYLLNGVYVQDPQIEAASDRIRLVATADWMAQFGIIPCGPNIDAYPVVTPTGVVKFIKPWMIAVAIVATAGFLLWLAYYLLR